MKLLFLVSFMTLSITCLFSASVRLDNDSPFKLRAVIRGADGMQLGEVNLEPHTSPLSIYTWTDSPTRSGQPDLSLNNQKTTPRSQTPFTVTWYCPDGSDFSTSENVSTGSLIKSSQGSGKKTCNNPNENKKNKQTSQEFNPSQRYEVKNEK